MTRKSAVTQRTPARERARRARASRDPRFATAALATVPLLVAGALAVAAPAQAAEPAAKRTNTSKLQSATRAVASRVSAVRAAVTPAVPSSYRVRAGDTVSSVAATYGLSTASVLTLNGLGWKSLIYPGQTLKLSRAQPTAPTTDAVAARRYTIRSGDTVTALAVRFGVSIAALLRANGLGTASLIYPGQSLDVPAASASAPALAVTLAASITPTATSAPRTRTAPTSYTVATGDSVSSIAAKFGVSAASVLAANGLDASSIIYPDARLTIPTASVYVAGRGMVTLLDAEMTRNARTIVRVGRSLGVSDRGLVIALAAAMQESALANIAYGHLDSVGLFQQRPSQHWGTTSQLLDPEYAARLFFGGPTGPNSAVTPGLLDIPGWQSMTVTQAAQAVQVSAYPDAYAQWETSARYWLSQLG
ncbi:LysM peptidoglycan-binding domain-containing protein [Galbitalea sp. SE-J8]|uniref:LysM peptidoglycan-binding domain-containing protein n=1 Tax=Galbitalea sp. SE-J8 TaxID=3054952 RepID=UPI00259CBC0F|nr:LysM peptidoglycan-binding domain-containing protein [Galbitalea sp. SE-J8]MDM4763073.1 LysM peptidoglycan-binding domain-containing protein [Galbitalea sp. SE-J8]